MGCASTFAIQTPGFEHQHGNTADRSLELHVNNLCELILVICNLTTSITVAVQVRGLS